MERTLKALKAAGYEHARVVMDLNRRTIEIFIGQSALEPGDRVNPLDRILFDGD